MKNVSIPITDDGAQCNAEYLVEYKLSGDTGYTVAPGIFTSSPIVINNLQEGATYDIRITRNCCDGQVSPPITTQVTTSLLPPENFTATPFVGEEIELTWDNDINADTYEIDRALDSAFTMSVTNIYSGAYTASVLDAPLTAGVTYYYRIKSQASGYDDSDYSYDNATAIL